MLTRLPTALALCALAFVVAGCPPKEVIRPDGNGHVENGGEPTRPAFEPKKNDDADKALADAIALADGGDKKKALESYLAVRKTYPETTAGQEALYRAGVLYFESKDYAN